VTDPDTPFLHVGINAPQGGSGVRRSFGVGVQNMSREYLPRSSSMNGGDGLLRLQARASYDCPIVSHPLKDWLPRLPTPAAGSAFPLVSFHREVHVSTSMCGTLI
jgi:hypothetical protein